MQTRKKISLTTSDHRGINIVDLMMWLVIAALLLATALQSIGYYQKAAITHQLESDLTGVASYVMSTSTLNGGKFDLETVELGAATAEWSRDVIYVVGETSSGGNPYIKASHSTVPDMEVIYLFKPCYGFNIGVNIITAANATNLESCGLAAPGNTTGDASFSAPLKWSVVTPVSEWSRISSSADGSRLIVGKLNEGMYTSSNGGATWNKRTALGDSGWVSSASSSNGNLLIAGPQSGRLMISRNAGATWEEQTALPFGEWHALASSGDGKKLVAAHYGGLLYNSIDGGLTWKTHSNFGTGDWYGAAASADGSVMVVAKSSNDIFISTNSGSTWTSKGKQGSGFWREIDVSDDGKKILAVKFGGSVYLSNDTGNTWQTNLAGTSTGTGEWYAASASADGTKLAVAQHGGDLYTSKDNGATWLKYNVQWSYWNGLDSSADGSKIFGSVKGGAIHAGTYGE